MCVLSRTPAAATELGNCSPTFVAVRFSTGRSRCVSKGIPYGAAKAMATTAIATMMRVTHHVFHFPQPQT
jgi:hypothetical protein